MKNYPMPIGKPKWDNKLHIKELNNLFGFIDAYVVCPEDIQDNPFLPYKGKDSTLIFGTGAFRGVYFSEELKYAKSIGYEVFLIRGYLGEGLFNSYITELYDKRLNAKKEGNDGLSYVYKILMNSLYGRFGINPRCSITEILTKDQYNEKLKKKGFTCRRP